jgi:hypothetical protein
MMTIDHTGQMFTESTILYIIGRTAFPIFAFMTAFSATKTRSLKKYTLRMFILAVVTQPIYSWANYLMNNGSVSAIWELNIFFTFTLCLVIIILLQTKGDAKILGCVSAALLLLLPFILPGFFDYAAAGVCLPLFYYFGLRLINQKTEQPNYFLFVAVCIISILLFNLVFCIFYGFGVEWWSMFGVVVLLFFTEKKPKFLKFEKWFFYVYYPLHLLVLSVLKVVL